MRKYELTYLVSDEVREGDLNKVTGTVNGFVTGLGGKIVKEDIWGRRKLAYPIKKADFATYVTLYFDLPPDKSFEFGRDLRQTAAIMRHLTIVKEHGHEAITLSASEIAATAEIEEVIGGEKSFEAVEGQTEESFDLMAKREVEEEPEKFKVQSSPSAELGVKKLKADKETLETPQSTEEIRPEAESPKTPELPEEKPADEKKPVVKTKKTVEKIEKPKVENKKVEKSSDEAERLTKLNEELDDILKDEL
ncbi:MAG: 30S ribosomal protein S6 [bacterium]|nr:30S ribosomal protein S6 [bacterium]